MYLSVESHTNTDGDGHDSGHNTASPPSTQVGTSTHFTSKMVATEEVSHPLRAAQEAYVEQKDRCVIRSPAYSTRA